MTTSRNCKIIEIEVPGRPGTSQDVLGRSRDEAGQDLETLKVPGPKSPGTKKVQKSRDFPRQNHYQIGKKKCSKLYNFILFPS